MPIFRQELVCWEEWLGAPSSDDEAYRRALRAFLASEVGLERAQGLRHHLVALLIGASALTWVLAAWPGLLSPSLRSAALGGWFLLFAAVLYAGFEEYSWLRRTRQARLDVARSNTDIRRSI